MRPIFTLCFLLTLSAGLFAQDAHNLFVQGNQAMNSGSFREAQQFYQAALAREPQNWNIHTMLGFSIHKQKRFKEADSIYRLVLNQDSASGKLHWYKGMNHIAMQEDSLAIFHYKAFIRLERNKGSNLIMAHRSIGQCYERMLKKQGLYSWQIDDMIYHYSQIELSDPSFVEVAQIRNFIELVQSKRPDQQVGKWKMEP